jgi:hypothetical protein
MGRFIVTAHNGLRTLARIPEDPLYGQLAIDKVTFKRRRSSASTWRTYWRAWIVKNRITDSRSRSMGWEYQSRAIEQPARFARPSELWVIWVPTWIGSYFSEGRAEL